MVCLVAWLVVPTCVRVSRVRYVKMVRACVCPCVCAWVMGMQNDRATRNISITPAVRNRNRNVKTPLQSVIYYRSLQSVSFVIAPAAGEGIWKYSREKKNHAWGIGCSSTPSIRRLHPHRGPSGRGKFDREVAFFFRIVSQVLSLPRLLHLGVRYETNRIERSPT